MDRTIVPTNLLIFPKVKNMVPDHKLIYIGLWQNNQTTACGCFRLDLDIYAAFLGFARNNLEKAILDFCEIGLVEFDEKTSEIFITDWWRFHKCETGQQIRIVQLSVDKIESNKIREVFFKAISHVSNKIIDLRHNTTVTEQNLNKTTTQTFVSEVQLESGGGDLKFSKYVPLQLHAPIRALLQGNNEGQAILDELAAELTRKDRQPIKNIVAWVRKVASIGVDVTPAGLAKADQRQNITTAKSVT